MLGVGHHFALDKVTGAEGTCGHCLVAALCSDDHGDQKTKLITQVLHASGPQLCPDLGSLGFSASVDDGGDSSENSVAICGRDSGDLVMFGKWLHYPHLILVRDTLSKIMNDNGKPTGMRIPEGR